MTSHNFAIVLGPTLLWVTEKSSLQLEQSSVESVIKVVADLIDNVHVIFPDKIDYDRRSEDVELRQMVLEKRMEAIALYSTSGGVSDQSEEGAVGGAAAVAAPSTGSQPSTPQLPPSSPGHRLSLQVPGQQQLQQQSGHHTAIPRSLTADSPSPNHKRKASIRSMGRNFIAKINPPGGSSSSNHHHHASKTPSPKEDLHHQHHGGGGGGGVRHDSDSGGGIS